MPAAHCTGNAAGSAHEKPAGHVEQLVAPEPALVCVPGEQLKQEATPPGEADPAAQAVGGWLALGQAWPAGHAVQVVAPSDGAT